MLHGVHGAVAELIRVPEKLELAMETALGASVQHIVMENESVSRQAIAFLKRRQLGRATFLPLDVIRPRNVSASDRHLAEGEAGFVGFGSELVKYDSRYSNIVGDLLGNVVIAETLEQANKIAARFSYRFRVVTLEGDVVNAGGSMTGGSQHKKTNSLLGRKRQLERLDQEITETEKQLEKPQEGIEGVRNQMIESQDKLDELRKAGDDKRIEEQQVAGDRKRLSMSRATSSNKPSWQARRRAVKRRKPKRFRQAVNARRSCCPSWRRKRNQPIWRSKPQNLPVKLMSRRRKSFRVS